MSEKEYPQSDFVEVKDITSVNHKPHPFVIGTKHVVDAANNHGGMLGQATMDKIPCDYCKRPASEHTSDKVMFLQLKRNCTNEEIMTFLKSDEMMKLTESEKVDGFAFVETDEKFRIQ